MHQSMGWVYFEFFSVWYNDVFIPLFPPRILAQSAVPFFCGFFAPMQNFRTVICLNEEKEVLLLVLRIFTEFKAKWE